MDTPYDLAADHPEIYENERYGMAAACEVQRGADGQPESATVTIDLGNYQSSVILHLSLWTGEYYMPYESQGIDMPTVAREGPTLAVQITTDPAQTRFRLNSVSPTTNLVLGYADCHDAAGGYPPAALVARRRLRRPSRAPIAVTSPESPAPRAILACYRHSREIGNP